MTKKLDVLSLAACIAAIAALAMWFASYSTYPAAAVNSVIGTLSGIAGIALMAVCALGLAKGKANGICILLAGLFLVMFIYQFALGRVSIAASVYFIPVNHPEAEDTAMNLSIVGSVAACFSFILITAKAFLAKDE